MEKKIRIKLPKWWLGISIKIALKKREGIEVIGVYNKVGNQYIPFLDYDSINNKDLLYTELQALQYKYDLGNAYIFKTGKGYHIIFTDLLYYDEWVEILNSTTCDPDYKQVPQGNGQKSWVLRLTRKRKNMVRFENVLYHNSSKFCSSDEILKLLLKLGVPKTAINNHKTVISSKLPLIFARYSA